MAQLRGPVFVARIALVSALAGASARPQLYRFGQPLPRHEKPPVVFVTGHDAVCPDPRSGELPFFELTFGKFDEVMARSGRASLVFEACEVPGWRPLEELGAALRRRLSELRYEDGSPVGEVDVVAHSMGGLIVRACLSGKSAAGFAPPAEPGMRRVVFIGTPHFGTPVADPNAADPQLRAMSPGSRFLFDLATWNQGTDDLRGLNALALAGTAGVTPPPAFTDSVVALTSAALDFAAGGQTRLLPCCHTFGGIGALFLCRSDSVGIARVSDERHPAARIVTSFLDAGEEWKSIGKSPGEDASLSRYTGLLVELRSADDEPQAITSANVMVENGDTLPMRVSRDGLAWLERVPAGAATLVLAAGKLLRTERLRLGPGGTQALVVKPGPRIARVQPVAGAVWPPAVAPGMRVEISGAALVGAEVTLSDASGRTAPLSLESEAAERMVAVLPEAASRLGRLRVRTSAGAHAINVLVEPSAPAIFTRRYDAASIAAALHESGAAVTPESPAAAGEIISIFLTGLGSTAPVSVTAGGEPCEVFYAGRAPGLAGVDQLNCRIADTARPDAGAPLVITAGRRSARAALPLR